MSHARWNAFHLTLALLTSGTAQTAHALASCTVSASATAFGSYSPFSPSPRDSVGNVRVSCTLLGLLSLLVSYTISLSTGASGSYAPRSLASGANTLAYNLYTNASRTTVWGNGSGGTATVNDGYLLGLLTTSIDYPVYGRIPAAQNVAAGFYSDTIVVQVDY